MNQNIIITIGREFGSGGRELARRLSEELGFAYYDQEILKEIRERASFLKKEKKEEKSFLRKLVSKFHKKN